MWISLGNRLPTCYQSIPGCARGKLVVAYQYFHDLSFNCDIVGG